MDAFIDETRAKLVEAVVALCWNEPLQEVLHERYEGAFVEVISHLDQLARCLPTRQAWDELVFLPPPTKPCMPHQSGHLGYIMGHVVDLGWMPPCNSASANRMGSSSAWHKACCLRGACWLMTLPLTGLGGSPCGVCHWQRRPLYEN